jgi:hypothetical protein
LPQAATRRLPPMRKTGRYEFFDEYNDKAARGALVVK